MENLTLTFDKESHLIKNYKTPKDSDRNLSGFFVRNTITRQLKVLIVRWVLFSR